MAQPVYVTQSSSGSTPWKITNWHATLAQQISFTILSTGGSSGVINLAFEDPTGVYPSPNANGGVVLPSSVYQAGITSFQLTAFTTGQTNQFLSVPSSFLPFVAWQAVVNTAGGKITFVMNQAGIG